MKKLILIFLITLFSHTSIGESYCETLKRMNVSLSAADKAKCSSSSATSYDADLSIIGTALGIVLSGTSSVSYDDDGPTASEAKRKADAKKAEAKRKAVAEAQRIAQAKRLEEERKARDKRAIEKRKAVAEAERIAQEKRISEARRKEAEAKRKADAKEAEAKRKADAKKAEAKRKADAKKAEAKRIAEEKRLAEEEFNRKLALIPPETALKKAQNFLSDVQVFVTSNPDEFDIIEITMFYINTKPISEGVLNDELMNTIESFREFVKTSNAFIDFEEKQQYARNKIEIAGIDIVISDVNSELSRIDQHMNKLKTYVTENLSTISPDLLPLIIEKVSIIKTTKNESSFDNKSEELKALRKVNEEISSFILDNNIATKAEIAQEKKRIADAKKAEERRKVAEAKRIADAKKAEERRKAAETKRIADAKKAEEKRKLDARVAEQRRIADAKKAEAKRIDDAKKAEAKRIDDAKKAEAKRIDDAYESGDYATALREWKPLAKKGDAIAQRKLGWMYREGEGVSKDYKTALKWFRLSAEQEDASAQVSVGYMYQHGYGVPKDYKTALKWYRLAAEQGYASAQNNLGYMYSNGEGVPKDDKTAVKWYRLAALQGDDTAQYNLGYNYFFGQGVPKDYKTSVKWYTLAAEQGYMRAQFNLGLMYSTGQGVPKDDKTAVKWYTLAAEQGDSKSINNLKMVKERLDQPITQRRFIQIIKNAKIKFNQNSQNPAVQGKVLYDRTKEICRLITSLSIRSWVGTVAKVETNEDGWGVLEIELDTNLKLSTREDVFGDYGSSTLINPGSNLFNSFMYLRKGDKIKFSGSFFKEHREKGTCLNIISGRLETRVLNPKYEFRFTRVAKIN